MKTSAAAIRSLLAAAGLAFAFHTAGAVESETKEGAAPAAPADGAAEAKAIFAAQCSWCHGDYGMKADKGPRLAGTQMTEREVEQRIRGGKPGAMPSFRKFLDDDQIALMARYIKSLPAAD